jgi:DNA uptake protein ComE-like DNA-binding protein
LYNVPRIRKKAVAEVLPFVRIGLATFTNNSGPPAPTKAVSSSASANSAGYKTINVNTATADDFMAFPGMTDAVANRIVKFRTSINGFSSVDDVAKTYGLHDSSFKIMRPYLTITPK